MSDNGLLASKVLAYMESLSPAARNLLVRAIQSAEARGEDGLPQSVVAALGSIQAAQNAAPPAAPPSPEPARQAARGLATQPQAPASVQPSSAVAGSAWRERLEAATLQPLQPFLIDVHLPVKQQGRIARASVAGVWTWIVRDVARREWEEAVAADPGDPAADVGPAARKLRRTVLPLMLQALREADTDPKGLQRLTAQLGGEAVMRDLRDVLYVLQRDVPFAALAAQLPRAIGPAEAESAALVSVLRAAVDQAQIDAAFVGAMILPRLAASWLLGPIAVRMTGTAEARLVAGGRYARLVDIALSESERHVAVVARRIGDRRERGKVGATLREFHEHLRNLQLSFEIETIPPWFKRIGGARRDMSEMIGRELESAPGLVRRALRVESLAGSFGGGFDADAFDDAEFALRLLGDARLAADNLALNDLLGRTRRQVEQTLEVVSGKLFADFKSTQSFDRASLTAAVDGAIRLCAIVFGEDYAAVLRKARDGIGPRPAARAG